MTLAMFNDINLLNLQNDVFPTDQRNSASGTFFK